MTVQRFFLCLSLVLLNACSGQPYRQAGCAEIELKDPVYAPVDAHGRFAVSRYLASIADGSAPWWDWSAAMAAEAASVHDQVPACAAETPPAVSGQGPGYPDEYSTALRTIGLYPLTRIPFVMGVERELMKTEQHYEVFTGDLLDASRWSVFGAAASVPSLTTTNVLLAPVFREALQGDLLHRFAPQFAVQKGADAALNRPGLPVRDPSGQLVWQSQPVLLVYAGVGQFDGRQTLQLNYQVWFSARPASGHWDPLAGKLDGLHWRVHLDQTLTPLAFDVMHTCGCWYQVFPASGYRFASVDNYWQEPVFIGASPASANPLVLVTADTHSVVGLRAPLPDYEPMEALHLAPAMVASGRPLSARVKAHRRLFNPAGYIPESARAERYFFWPMGIPAAGSMRAPGRQAIAFTGRRHFDDPHLLDQLGLRSDR